MAEITDLVTIAAILKSLITSGIQVDAETREKIATMTDEEVIAFARQLAADTDKRADEFLARLPAEEIE